MGGGVKVTVGVVVDGDTGVEVGLDVGGAVDVGVEVVVVDAEQLVITAPDIKINARIINKAFFISSYFPPRLFLIWFTGYLSPPNKLPPFLENIIYTSGNPAGTRLYLGEYFCQSRLETIFRPYDIKADR